MGKKQQASKDRGIYERPQADGTVMYQAIVRLKGHPSVTRTFPNKTLARRWRDKTKVEINEGRYFGLQPGAKQTLDETIARYRRDILPGIKSGNSRETHLRFWSETMGERVLTDIKTSDIVRAMDDLRAEGRSPGTANRYLATLRHLLNIAKRRWELIDKNPAAEVDQYREPRGRDRSLTDDERTKLLDACRSVNHDLYVAAVLALTTGARKSEIWGLRWSEVDLTNDVLTFIHTKNDRVRAVPLIEPAKSLLVDRWTKRDGLTDEERSPFVFPAVNDRNEHFDFTFRWRKARKLSGIQDFRWHDLRHTAASTLAAAGVSDLKIAEILGHRTLQMVKRYSHFRVDDLRDSVAALGTKLTT